MANPFIFAQGGSSSTSALVLNVTQTTSNGDDLSFGVSISATAVVRVTDTQGNNWTGVVTDVTETGEQIWTFESPGAAALVAGTDQVTIAVTSS